MAGNSPKITFGVIVLNGEPFTRYCLRGLYPYAHEIIVVEGACEEARAVSTPDGHSQDNTLEVLRRFKAEEDPDDKVQIVTAEDEGHPDGFWPGEKHEQSQAYANRATGDYLWQVDIDEFYMPADIERVLRMLAEQPDITAASFKQIQFWGGFDYYVDSWYLKRKLPQIHRLFKWEEDYQYATHRPPTVNDEDGKDVRKKRWIDAYEMEERGIYLYHYSLVFPKQVLEKSAYYSRVKWTKRAGALDWAQEVYFDLQRPFRVHNVYRYPGWLERYKGMHPPQIRELRRDLREGRIDLEVRPTEDIEKLLGATWYKAGKRGLKAWEPVDRRLRQWKLIARLKYVAKNPIEAVRRKASRFFL